MGKPQISLITPTFNRENEIKRCYASLLIQTDVQFEWIVVDDGSQDDTNLILSGLSKIDKRVIFLRNKGKGAQMARWNGFRQSKAEWVMFLDSDDELLPGCLKRRLKDVDSGRRNWYNGICQFRDGTENRLWRSEKNELSMLDSILELAPLAPISGALWKRSELNKTAFMSTEMWQDLWFHFELTRCLNLGVTYLGPPDHIIHMNTSNSISHGKITSAKQKAKWQLAMYVLDNFPHGPERVFASPLFSSAWNSCLEVNRYIIVRDNLRQPFRLSLYHLIKTIVLCGPKKLAMKFGKLNQLRFPYGVAIDSAKGKS